MSALAASAAEPAGEVLVTPAEFLHAAARVQENRSWYEQAGIDPDKQVELLVNRAKNAPSA
mgnify:CR=1 FL=1